MGSVANRPAGRGCIRVQGRGPLTRQPREQTNAGYTEAQLDLIADYLKRTNSVF
jgi:hypothetical protein